MGELIPSPMRDGNEVARSSESASSTGGRIRRSHAIGFLIWIGLAARVIFLMHSPIGLSGDGFSYFEAAQVIASTGKLPPLYVQPRGYSLFISPIVAVSESTEHALKNILHAHVLLDTIVVGLLLVFALKCLQNRPLAKCLLCLLILIQPHTASTISSVYTESTSQFFVFIGVGAATAGYLVYQERSIGHLGAAMLGFVSLLRVDLAPVLLAMLAMMLAYRVIKERSRIANFRTACLAFLFFSAPIISMLAWQYRSTGELGLIKPGFYNAGYMSWMRTWFAFANAQHDRFAFGPGKPNWDGFNVENYPKRAFRTTEERLRVGAELATWKSAGYSESTDRYFSELAASRRKSEPINTLILVPTARMLHFWINSDGAQSILRVITVKPPVSTVIVAVCFAIKAVFLVLCVAFCWIFIGQPKGLAKRSLRAFGVVAVVVVVLRTIELGALGIFAWAGLMEVRYITIVFPLLIAAAIVGASELSAKTTASRHD